MTETIQLQSVGHVAAIPAGEMREGDVRMYNFGSTALIIKIIPKSDKTLTYIIWDAKNNGYYMSDIRKTTLVAIVKRDQDVSEHRPTEAHNKGIVDVSEYFPANPEVEAVEAVEEINEAPQIQEQERAEKIGLSSITVSTDDLMGFFVTFADASKHIQELVNQTYDHCRIHIIWDDLTSHQCEYDLNQDPFKYDLSKRVQYYIKNVASLNNDYPVYGQDAQTMQKLLNGYQLEDITEDKEPEETMQEQEIEEITEESTNQKEYILNRETNKIELHFTKSEYMALSNEQKADLKRYYLFSGKLKAWVSRSTNNHYTAIKTAEKLGFVNGGKVGERLSYAEELEIKTEKAEARVERFEQYSENANNRAQSMQSGFKEAARDWSWVTQPIIAGHSGSERFGRQKQKLLDRYEKGFTEYRKSDYFKERAVTAQQTADQTNLKSKTYLNNRIEEGNKNIRDIEKRIVTAEEKQNNEWLSDLLEKMEYEMDKLAFFENCMDELGGVQYNKTNVKNGYMVKLGGTWAAVEKANTKTVEVKFSHVSYTLKYNYADIQEMKVPEGWTEQKEAITENPFNTGDIVTMNQMGSTRVMRAFQILKVTDKSVTIQRIKVESGVPFANEFINDKQERRGVKMNRAGVMVVNYDDYYLYKYNQDQEQSA